MLKLRSDEKRTVDRKIVTVDRGTCVSIQLLFVGYVMGCVMATNAAHAFDWVETTDAGPVIGDAQVVLPGIGALDSIFGTISNVVTDTPLNDLSAFGASVADVDIFMIAIVDPANFSAITLGGDSVDPEIEFDAELTLFDFDGFGVYENDDGVVGNGNSILPSGNSNGPLVAGIYYLAISDDDVTPLSSLDLAGPIFPDSISPFTAVFGPTGPGGAAPLLDWFPATNIIASRNYEIQLTGVPEPNVLTGLALGVLTLAFLGQASKREA